MTKSLEKLFNYLKSLYEPVNAALKQKDLTEDVYTKMVTATRAGEFGTWLSFNDQELEYNIIFDNFPLLSEYLSNKVFNDKDAFNIINYVLKRNIGASLLDDSIIVQASPFFSEKFIDKAFNFERIRSEYSKDNSYFESYIRLQKDRMSCEEHDPKTKEGLYDPQLLEYENLKHQHRTMYNAYLSKTETFGESDLIAVCSALLKLGFSSDVTSKYSRYMKITLEKRKASEQEAKEKATRVIPPAKVIPMIPPKPINQRLIKKTFKELELYFDFFNMEPTRPLTYDEIILCLAKLSKTDVTEGLMNEFIAKIDSYNAQFAPVIFAEVIVRRLKSYKELLIAENKDVTEVDNKIKILEEYISEYHSTEIKEDKTVWQEFIKEETSQALTLLPKSFK